MNLIFKFILSLILFSFFNTSYSIGQTVNGRNVQSILCTNKVSFSSIGNGKWQEYDQNGNPSFEFIEAKRDQWSVYLTATNDPNKKVSLDLFQKTVKLNGQGIYTISNSSINPMPIVNNRDIGIIIDFWSVGSSTISDYEIYLDPCIDGYLKAYTKSKVKVTFNEKNDVKHFRNQFYLDGVERPCWLGHNGDIHVRYNKRNVSSVTVEILGNDMLILDDINLWNRGKLIRYGYDKDYYCFSPDPDAAKKLNHTLFKDLECKKSHTFQYYKR